MQPQIAPLPGQGIGDAIASAGGKKGGDEAAAEGGYFACLGSNSHLPDLVALVEAVMETGALLSHSANQKYVGKGRESKRVVKPFCRLSLLCTPLLVLS